MNKLIGGTLTLVFLTLTSTAWSDTGRSHGNSDWSRHSPSIDTRRYPADGSVTPDVNPRTIDPGRRGRADRPPKYGYWSTKCVKQRGSSFSPWNHSKDCDHPAYSGGFRPSPYASPYGYGPPVFIINNYNGAWHRP